MSISGVVREAAHDRSASIGYLSRRRKLLRRTRRCLTPPISWPATGSKCPGRTKPRRWARCIAGADDSCRRRQSSCRGRGPSRVRAGDSDAVCADGPLVLAGGLKPDIRPLRLLEQSLRRNGSTPLLPATAGRRRCALSRQRRPGRETRWRLPRVCCASRRCGAGRRRRSAADERVARPALGPRHRPQRAARACTRRRRGSRGRWARACTRSSSGATPTQRGAFSRAFELGRVRPSTACGPRRDSAGPRRRFAPGLHEIYRDWKVHVERPAADRVVLVAHGREQPDRPKCG